MKLDYIVREHIKAYGLDPKAHAANYTLRALEDGLTEYISRWDLPIPAPQGSDLRNAEISAAKVVSEKNAAKKAQEAKQLLEQTDHKMLPDYSYPDDVPVWVSFRAACRAVVRDPVNNDIPKPPFKNRKSS